jgi:hypothetical protein
MTETNSTSVPHTTALSYIKVISYLVARRDREFTASPIVSSAVRVPEKRRGLHAWHGLHGLCIGHA